MHLGVAPGVQDAAFDCIWKAAVGGSFGDAPPALSQTRAPGDTGTRLVPPLLLTAHLLCAGYYCSARKDLGALPSCAPVALCCGGGDDWGPDRLARIRWCWEENSSGVRGTGCCCCPRWARTGLVGGGDIRAVTSRRGWGALASELPSQRLGGF